MLDREQILHLFELLNDELAKRDEKAEVGIVGGAVMCLMFHARKATRDVAGIFKPSTLIRELVARIAEDQNLPPDWLNDASKAYIQGDFAKQDLINLSHLRVWAPEAKYMLAMKCISARWDTNDRDDVIFLIKFLKLTHPTQVFNIIEHYYPKRQIPAKTQFFIDELFES